LLIDADEDWGLKGHLKAGNTSTTPLFDYHLGLPIDILIWHQTSLISKNNCSGEVCEGNMFTGWHSRAEDQSQSEGHRDNCLVQG